jgi:pantoate--beta-alanine ligase
MLNVCQTIKEVRSVVTNAKHSGKKISLVPTMGSLHKGHLRLIEEAKIESEFVIVSIFINKKQFNQKADYNKYPRYLSDDLNRLQKVGVDAVFCPSDDEIYPENYSISIDMGGIDKVLCGKDRLNHFGGVALIMVKLFSITNPDVTFFGLKDFQQFFIIKRLVQEFNIDTEIIGIETIREDSGLALSSRNLRLSRSAKKIANNIFTTLCHIKSQILENNKINIGNLLRLHIKYLVGVGFDSIVYLEIRDEDNLDLCYKFDPNKKYRIFISANIDGVRLIDNYAIY